MRGLTLESLWRLDQLVILLAIIVLASLGWAYLIGFNGAGMTMQSEAMPGPLALLGLSALMWSVMMVAMMLPSATPMILTYARVQSRQGLNNTSSLTLFVAGYLLVWSVFSLVAAMLQTLAYNLGLLASLMGATGKSAGGVLMIVAGLYQWSSLKDACLTQCQTPLGFLLKEWRSGRGGALLMGVKHGAICVGCCWALMLLMFAGGVMNLAWMAALTVYMLAEKVVPHGRRFGRLTGAGLVVGGLLLLAGVL
ncbi:DUF2182 domain-containing protein [Marinobacterium sp. D7]|uniref:DUF2182 domain-containing protein n=1 Tax=Marinobacterium ramblicola TaxID=2849041 RepID=UPI001C2DEEEC|nr:DUF2182 domain-containing protein [Marinobacterium ramblicola]MBV1786661.1 DUF2182 domain-containing protein [Marinobacterium ramblicola]